MEEKETRPGAAGKEEKRKEKKILDLLGGENSPSFLRPMIKQLFNYRSKTGKKTPKQSRGRIVRDKALKRNTRRYRGNRRLYQGKASITLRGKALNTTISNTCSRGPGKKNRHNPIHTRYI